jgi:cytidine deaminase
MYMEEKKIELSVQIFRTEELSPADNRLRKAAIRAAGRAYAPYSRLQVGAVALLRDGTVVEGNNQENVAYPSGSCAERVALFHAGASFPEIPVLSLAVIARKEGIIQKTVAPCGACRQVILETERRYGTAIRILLCGRDHTIVVASAKDLLPFAFSGM